MPDKRDIILSDYEGRPLLWRMRSGPETRYAWEPDPARITAAVEGLRMQLAEARAVIDKLPKDRDGNTLLPGVHEYVLSPSGRKCLVNWEDGGRTATPIPDDDGSIDPIDVAWCRTAERTAKDESATPKHPNPAKDRETC